MDAPAERRRFNGREKTALYLAADGRCESCGTELEPGWHADHVQPYSRDGKTDVINGQALCPPCNLKKGNSVKQLRMWQADALAKLLQRSDPNFLCVATPGAGKTTFALTAAQKLIARDGIQQIIVVVPTSHLRGQWARAAANFGIQLDHKFANPVGRIAKDFDGTVVTYQTIAASPLLWQKLASDSATLAILDEVHHAGEDDNLSWGPALKTAFGPAIWRLLLSGTPFRSDRRAIPFVKYSDDEERRCEPSYNYDYGTALADREVVRPIAFPALSGEMRWRDAGMVVSADLADASEEALKNALLSALDPEGDWIKSVLKRADEELSRQRIDVPDAGGLVVAPSQPHARGYARILELITGEAPTIAISDEPDASEQIEQFARGSNKWIVAVQMVSEGVDIPRLAVGVYASRIRTEMFFRQVVGRFVRMRGPEDETFATLFIPSIEPLLGFATVIEKTVNVVLAEEERQAREGAKNAEQQMTLRFDLVEPIDSSEAVHHSTILSGDSFSDEELTRAENAARASGMPTSVTAPQVARLLRMAGAGRVVGTALVANPAEPKLLADEKAALRRVIKRKVGRLNHVTRKPHSHINQQLNDICGDRTDQATTDSLNKRLRILDRWLEEQ